MSDIYLPIEERRDIIRSYAKSYGIRVFVETGTADASTTQALVPDFDELYTVEIDEGLYNHARLLFENEPKVEAFLGDSGTVLYDIVAHLGYAPAIFWLDGHYCGGPTRGTTDSPVIQELIAVSMAPKGSVALIDDARIFGGGVAEGGDNGENYTGYPDLEWVEVWAKENGFNYLLADDIIRLTPA